MKAYILIETTESTHVRIDIAVKEVLGVVGESRQLISENIEQIKTPLGELYIKKAPYLVMRGDGVLPIYVYPPNRGERLFGITFDAKLRRGRCKAQKIIDKKYAEQLIFRNALNDVM